MTEYSGTESRAPDYPEDWRDLVRRARQSPTEEVPAELHELFLTDEPERAKEIHFIERRRSGAALTDLPPVEIAGYRPPWVETAFRPQRGRQSPRQRVVHQGSDLQPLVVWGNDDRKTYNDLAYPWGCVCRVITAAGRVGSGVLIGGRHVLTASHCVDWSTSAAETIEVHRSGTSVRATTFDTAAIAFTQIQGSPSGSQLDEDYAVLVLNDRLGDAFGYFGSKLYDSGWDDDHLWTTIGYPTDIGSGLLPTYQLPVALDEDEFDLGSGRAMTTTADACPGQSGGPMFGMWDGVAYVVAVVSAVGTVWFSGVENWCAGGSDLNRLIREARQSDP